MVLKLVLLFYRHQNNQSWTETPTLLGAVLILLSVETILAGQELITVDREDWQDPDVVDAV